ncbi:MAG TPA: inositol monophosphatase [Acidimicrobiales bacterium]|nr:inositol monophosphatase [Acidimicrobiales bacterium]
MDTDGLLAVLDATVDAVAEALAATDDWGPAGTRDGQYRSDLAADRAALGVLLGSGLGVLSEESGVTAGERSLLAVVDPLDGSTNAARGIPWFATSVCVLDEVGPLVAVVADQARGRRWRAVRGEGATLDGKALRIPPAAELGDAVVALSGLPPADPPWRQTRILGAAALDLCAVAGGAVDGFIDCVADAHGGWDYLGGVLVCREAGGLVVDAAGRDLVVRSHRARRTPVAAAGPRLLEDLLAVRRRLPL